eukprot:5454447-Prymnesium_polylepis.1
MEMLFSGSSTLFTSVRASPKSGPVQYVQYWLSPSIAHTIVCVILPFPEYPKVSRYPCASRGAANSLGCSGG